MDNNNENVESLKEELKRLEEQKNKQLIKYMYVLVCIGLIFFLEIYTFLIYFAPEEPAIMLLIIILNIVLFFILCLFAIGMERDAGYYECAECHNRHVPSYKAILLAPHFNTTRWLKCPECGKKSWSKKVMTK